MSELAQIPTLKCVVVGDGAVGKTCMLMAYTKNEFPKDYVPTIFENYTATVTINDKEFNLSLWDTAGQEDYDKLRVLSYPKSSVFILAYSVSSPVSYENIKSKWMAEVRQHCPEVPIVLVATKADIRNDEAYVAKLKAEEGITLMTAEDGVKLAQEIGARKYVECSALTGNGLKAVYDGAIKVGIEYLMEQEAAAAAAVEANKKDNKKQKKKGDKKKCSIM